MVAVKGMLSMKALAMALTHRTRMTAVVRLPPERSDQDEEGDAQDKDQPGGGEEEREPVQAGAVNFLLRRDVLSLKKMGGALAAPDLDSEFARYLS
jgi:hypothetical protein